MTRKPTSHRLRRRRSARQAPVAGPRRPYMPHACRMALRRVQSRRAKAEAQGSPPPGRERIETLLRAGRAMGLLGRRRLVPVTLDLDALDLESGLWRTGARSIDELITATLLAAILHERPHRLPPAGR